MAVLPYSRAVSSWAGGDQAAQAVGHELAAVADPQNGNAPGKDLGVYVGRGLQVDAVRAAGKDDADGVHRFQLRQGRGVGLYFTVNAALPNPAGNELIILSAKIQDKHKFMVHGRSPFLCYKNMMFYFTAHR